MGRQYKCTAFGSCDQAGNVQWSSGSGSPVCTSCGGPMRAVGGAKARSGSGSALPVAGIAVFAALVLAALGYWLFAGGVFVPERNLLGRWQAEESKLLGVALPVGVQLEFTPEEAVVLDQRLKVASYLKDGDRVNVEIAAGGGMGLNLSFRFLEPDRVVYEGPMGIELRYRRRRDAP